MFTRALAMMLAFLFAVTIPTQNVQAEEMTYKVSEIYGVQPLTLLIDCEIVMAFSTDGLHIDFTTGCAGLASTVGIKDIKIQQKMWYGWKTVYTSEGCSEEESSMCVMSINYYGAVKDRTYRVLATHYADVDGYEEVVNDTGAFKFTY